MNVLAKCGLRANCCSRAFVPCSTLPASILLKVPPSSLLKVSPGTLFKVPPGTLSRISDKSFEATREALVCSAKRGESPALCLA